jgi:hypothetical protein
MLAALLACVPALAADNTLPAAAEAQQGATLVERIEDPTTGHGALQLNPANARRVLELFVGAAR